MNWDSFKALKTDEVSAGRLALHFAVQPLASAAVALAEHKSDFSHTSFSYSNGKFYSSELHTKEGTKFAYFDMAGFQLGLAGDDKQSIAEIEMWEKPLQAGFDFLSEELSRFGDSVHLDFPEYPDFPESAHAEGAVFSKKCEAAVLVLAELFKSTAQDLAAVTSEAGASPIRTWPHHFDMAVLVTLEGDYVKDASVGVGFSPGDGGVADPYWYVSPWPYPDATKLPAIQEPAKWNTEGWVGGVLSSRDLAEAASADEVLAAYIKDTFVKSRDLLKG